MYMEIDGKAFNAKILNAKRSIHSIDDISNYFFQVPGKGIITQNPSETGIISPCSLGNSESLEIMQKCQSGLIIVPPHSNST